MQNCLHHPRRVDPAPAILAGLRVGVLVAVLYGALVSVLACLLPATVQAAEDAQSLFSHFADRVYQIRVIERSSNNKSAIGSGFQISPDGLIASNYHVVSFAIMKPEKYRIEYMGQNGETGELRIADVDVIHDLAILTSGKEGGSYIRIADRMPENGQPIYSLGNPLDLGLAVVPGTYNGFIARSYYERLHFTGGINSGMSGGPAINASGELVGINVATAGNQVGFLVPKQKLEALLEHYRNIPDTGVSFKEILRAQLLKNQDSLLDRIFGAQWDTVQLGGARVLGEIVPFISCWGESSDDKDKLYNSITRQCRSAENIYLEGGFTTGVVEYEFYWLENNGLSDMRFYKLLEAMMSSPWPGNEAGKVNVTNFECKVSFLEQPDRKAVYCIRAYKEFTDIYDALYFDTSLHSNEHALLSHFTLSGVSRENAMRFLSRFLESTKWESLSK